MNSKNLSIFFKILILLFCFIVIYNKIHVDLGKYTLILMLLPVALMFEHINLPVFGSVTIAAISVSSLTFGFLSYETLIIGLIFVSSLSVLVLFTTKSKIKINDSLKNKNNELKFYKEELLNEKEKLIAEREILEKKLERITNFYIIAKDLTKNVSDPRNIANTMLNVLSTRQGINYCLITRKLKNKKDIERLLIFSGLTEAKKRVWYKAINNNKEIGSLNKPCIVNSLFDIEKKPVVVWPIKTSKLLDFYIYLIVEPNFAQTYLEEGEIFMPHLKLSAKRIALFFELKEKSRVDGLTGLYLKRYFIEKLNSEIERVKRYQTNFQLMMLDIDFFKKINDTYGHLTGDKVLKETARIVSALTSPSDIVGRYGGEEFIVLFPSSSIEKVAETAENIRKTVENTVFRENNIEFHVTISIGICEYIKDNKPTKLIDNADKALYEAKTSGRNRVVVYK